MVKYDFLRVLRVRTISMLVALSMLLLVVGGTPPAAAQSDALHAADVQSTSVSSTLRTVVAPELEASPAEAGDTIEVSNPKLDAEPQLYLSGKVIVVEMDMEDSSTTHYSVLTDAGLVRIDGNLDRITGGSTFAGTVALPASLTDRMSARYSDRVERSATSPINVRAVEGTQLVELAEAEAEPLQVVTAEVTLSQATLGTSAHTLDVAVLNGATFPSGTGVDDQVTKLGGFWVGQSNSAISEITRPNPVQQYTSAYLNNCKTSSNWAYQVWEEAAAKFGKSVSDYYSTSGSHLAVFASMPSGTYCSEGIGSVWGGTNGSGVLVANIGTVTQHTLAHEFGHNLGLGHANVHQCSNPALVEGSSGQGCYDYEYSDYYDVMSGGYIVGGINTNQLAALNVTDRVNLGFLPPGDLEVVGGSGDVVSLAPASDASGVRGVEVQDAITGDTYYVEYRSGTGMDAGAFYTHSFSSGYGEDLASLQPGVRILKARGTSPGSDSVALAMLKQPGDPFKMLALTPGDTFMTPSGGLSVTFTGTTSGNADVSIGIHALPQSDRIAGSNRYSTAVEVSKQAFPDPVTSTPVVYVAQGADYPDALGAAPAAVSEGGPLLLTAGNALTPVVKAEIQRLKPLKIVVVGGTGVIAPAVFNELETLAPGNTIRLGGANRYETARLVVRHAFLDRVGAPGGAAVAYVATGSGFPDALSASAAAGAVGSPVVLVNGAASSVDAATKTLLQDLGVTTTRIAGGTGVVSTGVQNSLATVSTAVRYAGANRFDTNQKINSAIFSSASGAYLATGYQFPDALAGAALAGLKGDPLYLVQTTCIPSQTRSDILSIGVEDFWLVGGTGVLTSRVANFGSC